MFKKRSLLLLMLLSFVLLLAGCGDSDDQKSDDKMIVGLTGVVDKIDPTNSGDPWALTSYGISETVFMQNEDGELVSHIVDEVEQKSDNLWEMTLKDGVKFSNGDKVDAKALSDCMNEIMQKNKMATASAGVMKFTPKDDNKVEIQTERKTTVMKSVLAEWTNVIYKKAGDDYVFTGPYMVSKLNPGSELELSPNKYYDKKADKRPELTLKAFKDGNTMKQAFESGEIDMAFTVTPEAAKELKADDKIVKNINAGYQYFAITNYKNGPTSSKNFRMALDKALDREAMLKALNGGRVATGFFAKYYDFAGNIKLSTDLEKAKELLKTDGYTDSDGDKYLDKDGKPLTLTLVTYPSRPDLQIIMQQTVSQLDKLGIKTTTKLVDNIDEYLANGEYDLAFYAQHTAPTGEPAYALNQFFRTGEGKNTMGYSNPDVDNALDQMANLPAGEERDAIAKEVQKKVYDDLPVLYMVDPKWNIAVSEKLKGYEPYCGDYYVINAKLGLK